MKDFIIVKRSDLSIVDHYVAEEKDNSSANRSQALLEPFCVHLELPQGTLPELVSAYVDSETGEVYLQEDPAKVAQKIVKDKTFLVAEAYNQMNAEVIAQMALVFGTTKPESATAYKETWDMMIETPSDWHEAGIRASFNAGGLVVGEVLDTTQKVQNYAAAKLAEVKAYGVWRMQRIEEFKDEREAILAQ